MPWVKLSDDFWMHPKIVAIGDNGAGLYARLLSYCGCYLTDGLVPGHMVEMIVGKNRKALEILTEHRLIDRLDSGSVVIRDYLDYNRSKAEIDEDRKQRKANGARGGRPKAITE